MPKLVSDAAENPQYTSPILLLPYFAAGGVAVGAIAGLFVALVVGVVDRVLRRRWWIDVLVRAVAVGGVALCTHAFVATSSDATASAPAYISAITAIGTGGLLLLDWFVLRSEPTSASQ